MKSAIVAFAVMKAFKSLQIQTQPMKYWAKIEVTLKQGHSDPEGEAAGRLLGELGYRVDKVNVGKLYRVVLEAESPQAAQTAAESMCKRLLANPTKDNYAVVIEETE